MAYISHKHTLFLDPSDGREAAIIADNTKIVIRSCLDGTCLVEFDDGEQAGQTLFVPASNVLELNISAKKAYISIRCPQRAYQW